MEEEGKNHTLGESEEGANDETNKIDDMPLGKKQTMHSDDMFMMDPSQEEG